MGVHLVWHALGLLVAFALANASASADKPSDTDALQGLTTGKVVWDINMTDPKKLSLYLRVIQETYTDLVRQGVKPDMIFAFRGRSVTFVCKDRDDIPLEQHHFLDTVAEQLADLNKREGVKMEACSVACRLFDVKPSTLFPGVKPVGNTFVSLLGYQAKGYAVIPIY